LRRTLLGGLGEADLEPKLLNALSAASSRPRLWMGEKHRQNLVGDRARGHHQWTMAVEHSRDAAICSGPGDWIRPP
jgi:hypothetical protein